MRKLSYLVLHFLILFTIPHRAQELNLPGEIKLVFDYLLKEDYPELFGNNPYQFRPIDFQITDIDDDGITEVFLQTFPHYRQSPTISIFRLYPNDSVVRVTEGLAPGKLIRLKKDDGYFDPHITGEALDMLLSSNEPEKFRTFAESALKHGMSVVLYKNFIHTDRREGKPVFIDLMHADGFAKELSCKKFQFEKPQQIISGKIRNKEAKYFVVLLDKELYCYRIKGFDNNAFLRKEINVVKKPENFLQLFVDPEGYIVWRDIHGGLNNLVVN